jgi:hypothetical protein
MRRMALAVLAMIVSTSLAIAQTLSPGELANRSMQRSGIEAVIWGMPAVNYDLMLQQMVEKVKGEPNQIVYWSGLPDWKNQTLTPNPDSIYLLPFIHTKEAGPMVIEIPPADKGSINGTIMDVWQMPLEDVGPAGFDKGKGGKYLILPPGYKGKVPKGYIVLPSATYQNHALLRSIVKSTSAEDIAKAVEYGKRIKVYPLGKAAKPPPTTFVDAINVVYDSTIPYDLRFFQALDRVVQQEPWLPRDRAMIDQLKAIGIEKGKPFTPDQRTQAILNAAALEARALLESRYEAAFERSYFGNSRWALPVSPEYIKAASDGFSGPDSYPVNDRGLTFSFAFFTPKHLGQGQFYLMTIMDKDGQPLSGANSYRLNVPANAPVKLYWSATIYDRQNHALMRDHERASRSSQSEGMQKNADGSVDVYFGPKAPAGKEANWVPTDPAGEFEILFRFYGPEKPLFDKSWKLPDVEKIAGS